MGVMLVIVIDNYFRSAGTAYATATSLRCIFEIGYAAYQRGFGRPRLGPLHSARVTCRMQLSKLFWPMAWVQLLRTN